MWRPEFRVICDDDFGRAGESTPLINPSVSAATTAGTPTTGASAVDDEEEDEYHQVLISDHPPITTGKHLPSDEEQP